MLLRITIDIFSGRPNPVIELSGKEAREAVDRLRPARKLKTGETGLPPAPTLGYRGLIIEQIKEPIAALPKIFRFTHGAMFGPKFAYDRRGRGIRGLCVREQRTDPEASSGATFSEVCQTGDRAL